MSFWQFLRRLFTGGRAKAVSLTTEPPDGSSGRVAVAHAAKVDAAPVLQPRDTRDSFWHAMLSQAGRPQPLTALQRPLLEEVSQRIQGLSLDAMALPRLPTVIPRLLNVMQDPEASLKECIDIVRKDPAIASQVMKQANSVFYNASGNEITSLERAVAALGINGLRTLLAASLMQPVMHIRSPLYREFGRHLWEHSLGCAVCAELIAAASGADRFKAYLLGLIHDVGALVTFSQVAEVVAPHEGGGEPSPAVFVSTLKQESAELSYRIARHWELPEDLVEALAEQVREGLPVTPLGRVLAFSNEVAEKYFLVKCEQRSLDELHFRIMELGLPGDLTDRLSLLAAEV